MSEVSPEMQAAADEWFDRTFAEFEELMMTRIMEARDDGVPLPLGALGAVSAFVCLITKLSHFGNIPDQVIDTLLTKARLAINDECLH